MKEIKLSQGMVALVDDEDFMVLCKWKWSAFTTKGLSYSVRSEAGIGGKRRLVLMHRQILGISSPKILCDHIDGNGLNNQRNNLRIATHGQNMANNGKRKIGTSLFKGVYWHKLGRKWMARIKKGGKYVYLGSFEKEQDAAIAYNEAAVSIRGEFARLNKIE